MLEYIYHESPVLYNRHMQTPYKTTLTDLAEAYTSFLAQHTHKTGDRYYCKSCERCIDVMSAYVSLHSVEFGNECVGQGRVWVVLVPYCATCEPTPNMYGCLHVPYSLLNSVAPNLAMFDRREL